MGTLTARDGVNQAGGIRAKGGNAGDIRMTASGTLPIQEAKFSTDFAGELYKIRFIESFLTSFAQHIDLGSRQLQILHLANCLSIPR